MKIGPNKPGQPKVRPLFLGLLLIGLSPFILVAWFAISSWVHGVATKEFINDHYQKSVKIPADITLSSQNYNPGDITNAPRWHYFYTTNTSRKDVYSEIRRALISGGYEIDGNSATMDFLTARNVSQKIFLTFHLEPETQGLEVPSVHVDQIIVDAEKF